MPNLSEKSHKLITRTLLKHEMLQTPVQILEVIKNYAKRMTLDRASDDTTENA